MAEFDIWQDRFSALANAITQFEGSLQSGTRTAEEQQEAANMVNLVKCLGEFAEKQFHFFYDGFVTQAEYILNPSREFPPEYVFSATLNQIAEDLEVLRRIADQRLAAETRAQLRQADQLAWSALRPAVESNMILDANTTVMTYFQKGASIRVIPYASVALVAIPFTAPSVSQDFLALPHEVGHYVYRHAKGERGKSIPQTLGSKLMALAEPSVKWARRWKEEVFADVYGCLIGGPVTALSFRDLALRSSRTPIIQVPGEYLYGEFSEDDGVHPVPLVRPYVYVKTLAEVGLKELAAQLDKDWKERPPVQETRDFRSRYTSVGVDYVSVEEAREEVAKIVDEVLDLLPDLRLNASFRWSGRSDRETMADLYGNFKTNITALMGQNNAPSLKPLLDDELAYLWQNWVKQENFFPGMTDVPPGKNITAIDSGKADRLEQLEQEPRYTWNHVFLAGGWATKLPGASGSGVVFPKNWQGVNQASGGGGSGY